MYKVIQFPGKNCSIIAATIGKYYNCAVEVLGSFEETVTHGFLVLPILSDDRIPSELQLWLKREKFPRHMSVIVLGDYHFDEDIHYKSPVADEVVRQLQLKNCIIMKSPLLVDTPHIELDRVTKWLQQNDYIHTSLSQENSDIQPKDSIEHHLYDVFGTLPLLQYDENGQIIEISFVTRTHYPYSLIQQDANQWEKVNALLTLMPHLQTIRLPFAPISEMFIDEVHLKHLKKLDVRGVHFQNYHFLTQLKNIRSLNLGANQLETIPVEVYKLTTLETLTLYKNMIATISDEIENLQNLKKLKLYRNQLTSLPISMQKLPLKYLNIGANPITFLPPLQQLEYLNIRNCNLTKEIIDFHHYPYLVQCDLSKNPVYNS